MSLIGLIKNDYGATITLTVQEDGVGCNIAGFTILQVLLWAPDGNVIIKTATFATNGADGVLKVLTADGDLDQVGGWLLQVKLSKVGQVLHSNAVAFVVGESLG